MKVKHLEAALNAHPFRPFAVRIDGEVIHVRHPEQVFLAKPKSTVVIDVGNRNSDHGLRRNQQALIVAAARGFSRKELASKFRVHIYSPPRDKPDISAHVASKIASHW